MRLNWKRNPTLDVETAETPLGTYYAVRTHLDVAVLRFNGRELRRSASDGSHAANRAYAQAHHDGMLEGQSWRHKKGGLYTEVGEARHSETLEALMVYRSAEDWRLWARPLPMFLDGRFTREGE